MTFHYRHIGLTAALSAVLFSFCATLFAAPKNHNDARENERRIQAISKAILTQVTVQENEYKKKVEEHNQSSNNMGGYYGGDMYGQQQQPTENALPPYQLDRKRIEAHIASKYPCNETDMTNGKVDLRTKDELQEAALQEIAKLPEFQKTEAELLQQEIEAAKEKYPLYKDGEIVEIRFARGNEPGRTYRGAFHDLGKFKIQIGREILNRNELPDIFKARFDELENKKAIDAEIAKHLLINEYNLKKGEAVAKWVKDAQTAQFQKNLPRNWVLVGGAWRMPKELVDDTLDYRKSDLKLRNTPRPMGGVQVYPGASN